MNQRLMVFGGIGVVVLFLLWNAFFIVNAREQAIVVRFGEIQAVKTKPGLYFKLPFSFVDADKVQLIDDRARRFDLNNIRLQVSGGKFYDVDAFVIYKVEDARKFRQAVSGDFEAAEARMRTRLDSALRRVYGLRNFEAALSIERNSMMKEVADLLRPAAERLGIALVDVRIRRTDLTKQVSEQTYKRMKSERLAEAALIRARGSAAAQGIRAAADRQVVEIVSQAQRDADITRGQGDEEAARIYADAYNQNRGFYDFYRSMNAYQQALQSSNTTLVLSPDSAFFRFFRNPSGGDLGSMKADENALSSVIKPTPPKLPEGAPARPPSSGADNASGNRDSSPSK